MPQALERSTWQTELTLVTLYGGKPSNSFLSRNSFLSACRAEEEEAVAGNTLRSGVSSLRGVNQPRGSDSACLTEGMRAAGEAAR